MNLPTPRTAVGKMAYRASIVAVIAGLGYVLKDPSIGQGGLAYFVIKSIIDLLNSNIQNI